MGFRGPTWTVGASEYGPGRSTTAGERTNNFSCRPGKRIRRVFPDEAIQAVPEPLDPPERDVPSPARSLSYLVPAGRDDRNGEVAIDRCQEF